MTVLLPLHVAVFPSGLIIGSSVERRAGLELACGGTVEMNTLIYNAAVSACSKCGEWEKALALLSLMVQGRMEMDTTTYNAAMTALARIDRAALAKTALLDAVQTNHCCSLGPRIRAAHGT